MVEVSRTGAMRWEAGGALLRALLCPDDKWRLLTRAAAGDVLDALVAAAVQNVPGDLYINVDGDGSTAAGLATLGFGEHRRERHYAIRVAAVPESSAPGFAITSARDVDLDRLRLLDDELRQDVPGSHGWRNEPATFADQVFGDPEFDPATYLIAVDEASGRYAGLVRVWIRPARPRLGLIAVGRDFRRRGLALALLGQAFAELRRRGIEIVECEVDMTNVASNTLIQRLDAQQIGESVELVRRSAGTHAFAPVFEVRVTNRTSALASLPTTTFPGRVDLSRLR